MSRYELAQLNIGKMKGPLDSPLLADFVSSLDRINALAEASAGFVWRLQTPEGDATALRPLGEDTLVNMSVWRDVAALRNYVYRSAHVDVMRRRKEWFEHMTAAFVVLWWVPEGHHPTIQEAISKLELLRGIGPSEDAFTFRQAYRSRTPRRRAHPSVSATSVPPRILGKPRGPGKLMGAVAEGGTVTKGGRMRPTAGRDGRPGPDRERVNARA
jgi:hypothetical protein